MRKTVSGVLLLVATLVGVGSVPAAATLPSQALDRQYCEDLVSYLDLSKQLANEVTNAAGTKDAEAKQALFPVVYAPAMARLTKRLMTAGDPALQPVLAAQNGAWSEGVRILVGEIGKDGLNFFDASFGHLDEGLALDVLASASVGPRKALRLAKAFMPTIPQLRIVDPLADQPTFVSTATNCGVLPEVRDCATLFPTVEASALYGATLVPAANPVDTCVYAPPVDEGYTFQVWLDVYSTTLIFDRLKIYDNPKVRGVGDAAQQTTDVAQQGTTYAAKCLGRQLVARVGGRTLFLAVCGAQPSAKKLAAAARAIVDRLG